MSSIVRMLARARTQGAKRPTPTQSTCLYYDHDNEASKCSNHTHCVSWLTRIAFAVSTSYALQIYVQLFSRDGRHRDEAAWRKDPCEQDVLPCLGHTTVCSRCPKWPFRFRVTDTVKPAYAGSGPCLTTRTSLSKL
jgi:hypothetical protein